MTEATDKENFDCCVSDCPECFFSSRQPHNEVWRDKTCLIGGWGKDQSTLEGPNWLLRPISSSCSRYYSRSRSRSSPSLGPRSADPHSKSRRLDLVRYFSVSMPDRELVKQMILCQDDVRADIITTNFRSNKNFGEIERVLTYLGGYKIYYEPNAGGSSILSEVMSFEFLRLCFNIKLMKTEMEVKYTKINCPKIDFVCQMFDTTVGVSVTRAMQYKGDFNHRSALHLLKKKLKGVDQSTKNSLDKWVKQILHIWSTSESVTENLVNAYKVLEPNVVANAIVLITTAYDADYIFSNKGSRLNRMTGR